MIARSKHSRHGRACPGHLDSQGKAVPNESGSPGLAAIGPRFARTLGGVRNDGSTGYAIRFQSTSAVAPLDVIGFEYLN